MEEGPEGGQEGRNGQHELTPSGSERTWARRARWGEPALAALFTLWVARSFWLPGRYVVGLDTVAYTAPNFRLTVDEWRAGRIPLWNDLIFGGVTHAGNPQAGVFSPAKVVGLLAETNRALNLTVALHLVLMAVTTVFLLRRLGARPPAALLSAVVMVGNGAVLTRSIQFEQIVVLAWTPALLWGITAVLLADRRAWGAMAATAGAIAMVLVSGHPQITYQVAFMAAAWSIGLAWTNRRRIGDLAVAVGVGTLTASIHLLAAVAGTRDSAISTGRDLDELASPLLATRPEYLASSLLGTVRGGRSVEFAGGFESIGHLGVVGAALALFGLWALATSPGRRALVVAMSAAMVLAAVWALGPRTPLFRIAYDWLPGFDLARGSARWIGVTAVFGAVAAGLGAEAIRQRMLPRWHVAVPAGALALVLGLAAAGLVEIGGMRTAIVWVATLGVVAVLTLVAAPRSATLAVVALCLVATVELGAAARTTPIHEVTTTVPFDAFDPGPAAALVGRPGLTIAFTDDAFDDPPYLVAGLRPNTNVLTGVASIDGYDGGVQVTERFAALIERLSPAPDVELPLRNNLPPSLDVELASSLGVRWALVDDRRDGAALLPGWHPRTDWRGVGFTVWENRAWIGDAVMTDADGIARPAELDRRSPTRLVVDVHVDPAVATERTLVVYRQTAPGWSASVDGVTTPLSAGDGFFLTVELPADARTVELRYRPRWLLPGLGGSSVGLAAMAAMSIIGRRRRDHVAEADAGADAGATASAVVTATDRRLDDEVLILGPRPADVTPDGDARPGSTRLGADTEDPDRDPPGRT